MRKWQRKYDHIYMYVDGSCNHLSGEGGWAYVVLAEDGMVSQDAGHVTGSTNNSMELCAVVEGLESLKGKEHITVYTDSNYIINAVSGWWDAWQANNWYKKNGVLVSHVEYWKRLLAQTKKHEVDFEKVKAHNGDRLNQRCDRLAKEARRHGQQEDGDWKRSFKL